MAGTNDPQARRPDDELDVEELENVAGGVDSAPDTNSTKCTEVNVYKCAAAVGSFDSPGEL